MPENEQTGEVTKELRAFTRGDSEALDRVMELVYAQLRRIAHKALRSVNATRSGITLETEDLFHESFLKLKKLTPSNLSFDHRGGFFRYCIRIMQSHLREHADKKRTLKRGDGFTHVSFDDFVSPDSLKKLEEVIPNNSALSFADVLAFEDLLGRHAREFERQADVLAHRIYLGLTEAEIAQVLGVSTATVNRDLRDAKEWLEGQWNSDQ